jgi:anti-sigma regulatory factor (Ser/Thr protein kinase)
MGPTGELFTLSFPSELHLVVVARTFVESVCHATGLERHIVDAVVLCAHEAIGNAIRHGNQGRSNATVVVTCRVTAESIEVCIHDEGPPFCLGAVPSLDPSEIRPGGRGIFLMRKLMDELKCLPREGGGNIVCLTKYCRHTPQRSPIPSVSCD